MRYIHFWGSNGYCGTDYHELREFDDNISDEEIAEISADMAYDCAESYSYLATGWDDDFESEEYFENAVGYCGWTEVSAEEYEELMEDYC